MWSLVAVLLAGLWAEAGGGHVPGDAARRMATLPRGAVPAVDEPLEVWEALAIPDSPITFVGVETGTRFDITKSGERIVPTDTDALWGGRTAAEVLDASEDLLGNNVLARDGEPTYAEVAALLPPVLASQLECGDFQLDSQSFVGSRVAADKRSFTALGQEHGLATRQDYHLNPSELGVNNTRAGLLGAHLPALRWSWSLADGGHAEQLAFAAVEGTPGANVHPAAVQPVWQRFLNVSANGSLRYVHYVDTFESYPVYCNASRSGAGGRVAWAPSVLECDGENAAGLYAALLTFALYWNATWEQEQGMTLELPNTTGIDIASFARHGIVREMITRRELYFPRYGAPPQAYGSRCCDGFQDVFVTGATAYLEWGLFTTARGVIDNYMTWFVRSRARVMYRGPEVGQFGRMLTVLAHYYRATGDGTLLLDNFDKLSDISDMLLARRRAATALPPSDPTYGLLRGTDESDELLVGWTRNSSELPHFSISLETWRGFRDIGAVWAAIGESNGRQDVAAVGANLSVEATSLLRDINVAIARNVIPSPRAGEPPCHPYVAGVPSCAALGATDNARAAEPWRTYSEMLWSGGLNGSVVEDIVAYNQGNSKLARVGVWSGVDGFDNRLISFTEHGHGYGLVQHDIIEPFLLQLHAEMAHACSRGSWTCFETRGLPNWTPAGGYSTPSQLVVPLHVKWMLVWTDPLSGGVTLCKATPRAWLESGNRIAVARAPVPRGRVSFNVTSHLGEASGRQTVVAVVGASAAGVLGGEAAGVLRLRVPAADLVLVAVQVDGAPWTAFDPGADEIHLPPVPALPSVVNITATFGTRRADAAAIRAARRWQNYGK